jgi:Ternary complex associated domain 9
VTLADAIVDDIFHHNRDFLPGAPCSRDDVLAHMAGAVNHDNLLEEERLLLLSILPRNATKLWVSAMDKGLSGSKVFAVRYSNDGSRRLSKPFVCKIGRLSKIDHEAEATYRFASPYLHGVPNPIYRRGQSVALIGQELHGLSANVTPLSLRLYVRNHDDGDQVLSRFIHERLEPWYCDVGEAAALPISSLTQDYRKRGPRSATAALPDGWNDLTKWTEDVTSTTWDGIDEAVSSVLADSIVSPVCIIHGDLHSQNVLVDPKSKESWPIDFAWCRESSPVLDLAMLECSLKFLALPMRSDLRTMMRIEAALASDPWLTGAPGTVPYSDEIGRIIRSVNALRRYALENIGVTFSDYRKVLLALTFSLSPHEGLNRPYVIASLQILGGTFA